MGPKQSSPVANARIRAYSGSDVHPSASDDGSGTTAVLRYYSGGSENQESGQRGRYTADNRPNSLIQSAIIPNTTGTHRHSDDTDEERGQSGPRLLIGSLPAHLSPHLLGVNKSEVDMVDQSEVDMVDMYVNPIKESDELDVQKLCVSQMLNFPAGFHCPVCSKFVGSDEMELHLVMCLTKPRLTYNEDVLAKDSEECAICLDQLVQGDTIARLPCLCIYHKGCIDEWFEVNRSCPEHPSD